MNGNRKHSPPAADDIPSNAPGVQTPDSAPATSPLQDDYFENVASSLDQGWDSQPMTQQAQPLPQPAAPPMNPPPGQSQHSAPASTAAKDALFQPGQHSQPHPPHPSHPPYPPSAYPPSYAVSGMTPQQIPHGLPPPMAQPAMAPPPTPGPAGWPAVPPDAPPAGNGYWVGYQNQAPGSLPPPQAGPAGQDWSAHPPSYPSPYGAMPGGPPPPAQHQMPGMYESQGAPVPYAVPGRYTMYGEQAQIGGDISIPRISLQCFVERPFVQSTLVSVMRDRRMANVSMEIEVGGIAAAIRHFAANETPHLVVVESTAVGERFLSQLDALASQCDESVKVIVIGAANDVHLYRELKRRGVSEYLVPPIHPVQFIQIVSSLFTDENDPFIGRTVAVCGARGGCGASTIAHNLAWSFAERIGMATTLVDLDLGFGTVGLDFNQESVQSIADILASPDELDIGLLERMVAKVSRNLSLLNAPVSLDSQYEFDSEVYIQVIDKVRRSVPLVVLDMPHVWTDWSDRVMTASDEILVVATPDLTSLRNVQKLFRVFADKRINDGPPHLLLNMTGVAKRPEIPVTEFTKVANVRPATSISFDARLFGKAANNGQMLAMVDPDANCVKDLDDLATTLIGRKTEIASQTKAKTSVIVDKVKQFLPGS